VGEVHLDQIHDEEIVGQSFVAVVQLVVLFHRLMMPPIAAMVVYKV
jgi:hypothetical protein